MPTPTKAVSKKAAAPTKAAAKKAAAPKAEPPKRGPAKAFDKALQKQVVELRDKQEQKWAEIAEATGLTEGQALQAYDIATCPAKEKIRDATGKDIVQLRDGQSLSWGQIVARTEIPESRCRSMYDEAVGGGKSAYGSRIGKGGRYPGSEERPAKAAAPAKKAAAKVEVKMSDLHTVEDWEKLLTGKTVNTEKAKVKVASVKSFNDEKKVLSLVDATTGSARTIRAADIKSITK